MNRTSSNSADWTATNRRTTNQPDIKISVHVGDRAKIKDNHLQLNLISPPQVEHQAVRRHWWQGLNFRAKGVAIAIAVLTLTVLPQKVSANFYFNNPIITEASALGKEPNASEPADIASAPPRQIPLILVIEALVAALLLVAATSIFLAYRAMRPRLNSADTTKEFDKETFDSADIAFARLATKFAENQAILPQQKEDEAERSQLLTEITRRLRESVYIEDVLKTTVKEVRRLLKVDRVYLYRFNSDWSGIVAAESVAPGWPSCLNLKVIDTDFTESNAGIEQYKNGYVRAIDNIYKAELTDVHIKLLEQFAIKAQMVAPILKNNQLFALMVANQCSEIPNWEKPDIDLFAQLAIQVGFALDQASLLEQQESDAERSQLLMEISRHLRQSLNLEDLLKTTVKEVRRVLKADRALILGLDPSNWDGVVVAESVAPGWPQTFKVKIDDPCLRSTHVEMYKNGRIRAINDIYQDPNVTDCYRKTLEQFAVKAVLVAPILRNKELLGLMIAHQCSEPRNWQKANVDLFAELATQVGLAVEQVSFLEQQESEAEREQLLTEITLRIRQSLYLEDILKTTVKEVRRALKTHRVLIFGLDPTKSSGMVIAESVGSGWPQTFKVKIDDPCLRSTYVEMYKNGRIRAINDIYQEPNVTECYRKTLEQFAVQAVLVAPILRNKELLGLMIAHQCSEPRNWQKSDIDLFRQLAIQVGFAIDQANLLEQTKQEQAP